jgi:hypothetical protein
MRATKAIGYGQDTEGLQFLSKDLEAAAKP